MRSVWDNANPHLRTLKVYQPGKPIEETARELGCDPAEIIKLASNENPLGPSPRALSAMRAALENLQLYPDGGGFYLREALARKLGVDAKNLILGNGSNEIIELLAHAFLKPGDVILTSEHAFIAYKLIAKIFGAQTIEVPSKNFGHDLDAMVAAITEETELIFIANPNNPTGTMLDAGEIDRFLARIPPELIVIFDEAYYEFVDQPPDTLRYVREGKNVIVLRTFSKIHGLAGLRIGYGIAPPELIEVMQKTRQPFNVNSLALAGALAAVEDDEHLRATKKVVDDGRKFFERGLRALGLEFIPSAGNFILVHVGDGPAVFQKMLERKVIVRAMGGYDLPAWIRITIGTMPQNQRCLEALQQVVGK